MIYCFCWIRDESIHQFYFSFNWLQFRLELEREFFCFSDDFEFLFLLFLFADSVVESLFLPACLFRLEFAELERLLFCLEAGDFDRDVLLDGVFFFNEAPWRPLCGEFFTDLLVVGERELEFLFFVFSNFVFRLWISRVSDETALDVDFAISSSSSCGETLGLKSIWLEVSEVAYSCRILVAKASSWEAALFVVTWVL